MRIKSPTIWLLSAIMILVVSCKHGTVEPAPGGGSGGGGTGGGSSNPCDPTKVYFQQQVLPILISNCSMSGCHDVASHQEGVILTSYASVMSTGGIEAGDPNDSELYERIIDTDPDDRMPVPPRSPLTAAQKDLIKRWIQQGALDITCQSLCDTTVFTYSGAIKPLVEVKCQGCHSTNAALGGIDLSTYNGIKLKINDGRLWGAVNHHAGFSPMPKNGNKLSDCELTQIRKWIEGGSPNN